MPREDHYIPVDRDRVMRCAWCGTSESNHWMKGSEGKGPYCSQTCVDADKYNEALCATILFPILWLVMIISVPITNPEITYPSDFMSIVMVYGALFLMFVCCPLTCSLRELSSAKGARKKVVRGSRRLDRTFGLIGLKCKNCGAPLDTKDAASLVKCEYCGTQNRVSVK